MADAIACVVTKEEHDRLKEVDKKKSNFFGWESVILVEFELSYIRVFPLSFFCCSFHLSACLDL